MINGIGSSVSSASQNMLVQRENYVMTDEQKEKVSSLLEKYDTSNMTETSTKSLMDEIKSLGVKPGEDLKEILDSVGINPPKGQKPPPPPPKQEDTSITNDLPSFLTDFINKFKSGSLTEEDTTNLIQQLKENDMSSTGNIYDKKV